MPPNQPRLPYRLSRHQLGEGGYADVRRGEHRDRPGHVVAVKRPLRGVPFARERMAQEIRVQRLLDHEHIMPILDAAPDGSWYAMPVAEGNLETLLPDAARTDPEAFAVVILRAISSGLEHAHREGFIHRDVSPRNILALPGPNESDRRWVIADWGLVRRRPGETTGRLTPTGARAGTEGFAAPETWTDAHHVDERADVYSLGRVAAWIATGTWPSPNVALLPQGALRGLIAEATELDRVRRIGSMTALRDRMDALLARPILSPRGEMQALIELAIDEGLENESEAIALAAIHPDDQALFVDELARMPTDLVRRATADDAEASTAAADRMLFHIEPARWGNRDYDYANVPLRWVFEVVQTLVSNARLDLAEDLATGLFAAEVSWNRFRQQSITLRWLKGLREPDGAVIARAIRRSGARDYYAAGLADGSMASRSLAAEFGL